jgi:hypothetical protein
MDIPVKFAVPIFAVAAAPWAIALLDAWPASAPPAPPPRVVEAVSLKVAAVVPSPYLACTRSEQSEALLRHSDQVSECLREHDLDLYNRCVSRADAEYEGRPCYGK